MVQTAYDFDPAIATPGMLADLAFCYKRVGYNTTGASLPFGIAVKRAAAGGDYIAPLAAATDKPVGIILQDNQHVNRGLAAVNGLAAGVPDKDSCNVIFFGPVQVKVEEAVVAGDDVFVRHTSDGGSNLQPGTFRKSIDSNRAMKMAGAKFLTPASSGGYAVVWLSHSPELVSSVNPFFFSFNHAVAAADQTNYLFKSPPDRYIAVTGARYFNETGLAQDVTNFFNIKLQTSTPTVIANWSTETGQQGSIAAATWVNMVLAATPLIPPASTVQLFNDEGGNTSLPAGLISVEGYYI